jgi:hypothetical protein
MGLISCTDIVSVVTGQPFQQINHICLCQFIVTITGSVQPILNPRPVPLGAIGEFDHIQTEFILEPIVKTTSNGHIPATLYNQAQIIIKMVYRNIARVDAIKKFQDVLVGNIISLFLYLKFVEISID